MLLPAVFGLPDALLGLEGHAPDGHMGCQLIFVWMQQAALGKKRESTAIFGAT